MKLKNGKTGLSLVAEKFELLFVECWQTCFVKVAQQFLQFLVTQFTLIY